MNWLRLEKALETWSRLRRERLPLPGWGGFDDNAGDQALFEALDCKTENLRFAERVDALERLAVVAARVAEGRTGGFWTEMHEILKELG